MKKSNWGQTPHKYYYASFIIIGINVFIFFLTMISGKVFGYLAMNPVLVIKYKFIWQIVTYMFVHGGFTHILFNMLGLLIAGVHVEKQMGSSEFILFYLITGALSGIFSLLIYWFTGNYRAQLVGASGAVYAVLLAFATYFPTARIFIWGVIPVRAPILVLILTGFALVAQITGLRSGVAHMTHLAGFVFAYLYFLIRFGINPIKVFFDSGRR